MYFPNNKLSNYGPFQFAHYLVILKVQPVPKFGLSFRSPFYNLAFDFVLLC